MILKLFMGMANYFIHFCWHQIFVKYVFADFLTLFLFVYSHLMNINFITTTILGVDNNDKEEWRIHKYQSVRHLQ